MAVCEVLQCACPHTQTTHHCLPGQPFLCSQFPKNEEQGSGNSNGCLFPLPLGQICIYSPHPAGTISEDIGHLPASVSTVADSHLILSNHQPTSAPLSASLRDFWRVVLEAELVVSCLLGLHLVRSGLIWLDMDWSSVIWLDLVGSGIIC